MRFKSNIFSAFSYLFFFLCLLPIGIHVFKHPAYNWDMLGYMALVIRMDQTKDINKVHTITYDAAKQNVPSVAYKYLTDTPSFRKRFAIDPLEFQKVLPIHVVKPLYLWLCYLFYKTGVPLTTSTLIPSIISFFLIGLLLFHWLKKYLNLGVAFLAGLLILYSSFIVNVARLSTPDCLSAFFLFSAAYFIFEKRNTALMFLFFLLSVFARVDNVITCFIIISFLTFGGRWKMITKKQYFLMSSILAIAYIAIVLPVQEFGWSIFYYSQYARQIDFSKDFDQAVSLSSYVALVYSKIVTAIVAYHFCFFMFLALLIIMYPGTRSARFTFDQSFLLVLISILILRFLLLPDLSDRFYLGFYLIIIILLIRKLKSQNSQTSYENH